MKQSGSKRSLRRLNRELKRNFAARMVRRIWKSRNEDVVTLMVHNCDNLKMCGKDCCKNPRRSKHCKASGKTRRELFDDVAEQSVKPDPKDDVFTCSKCGHVMRERDRSGNTTECCYC